MRNIDALLVPFASGPNASLAPADLSQLGIDREEGWPDRYVQQGGDNPEREVFHRLLLELFLALQELQENGFWRWSRKAKYKFPCVVWGSNNKVYRSTAPSGPDPLHIDPVTDINNVAWEEWTFTYIPPAIVPRTQLEVYDWVKNFIVEGTGVRVVLDDTAQTITLSADLSAGGQPLGSLTIVRELIYDSGASIASRGSSHDLSGTKSFDNDYTLFEFQGGRDTSTAEESRFLLFADVWNSTDGSNPVMIRLRQDIIQAYRRSSTQFYQNAAFPGQNAAAGINKIVAIRILAEKGEKGDTPATFPWSGITGIPDASGATKGVVSEDYLDNRFRRLIGRALRIQLLFDTEQETYNAVRNFIGSTLYDALPIGAVLTCYGTVTSHDGFVFAAFNFIKWAATIMRIEGIGVHTTILWTINIASGVTTTGTGPSGTIRIYI